VDKERIEEKERKKERKKEENVKRFQDLICPFFSLTNNTFSAVPSVIFIQFFSQSLYMSSYTPPNLWFMF
jgi:hypothetical protein